MIFVDRTDAAMRLAQQLTAYRGKNPLILAIPRGAVPMAQILAQQLDGQFDVVLVRKLRAPLQPELAVGAVDEAGAVEIADFAASVGADQAYIAAEIEAQLQTIRQRRAQYRAVRKTLDPAGRIVIVVDDGLATGMTMVAALRGLRAAHPAKLVCAVPVASSSALNLVAQVADEVVCVETPAFFGAVGQFYQRFDQIDDTEVLQILRQAAMADII